MENDVPCKTVHCQHLSQGRCERIVLHSRKGGRQASGKCLEAMYVRAKRDYLFLNHSTRVYDAMHAHAQALVLQSKRYIFRNCCSRD